MPVQTDSWYRFKSDEACGETSSEDETGQSTRSCLVLYGMGALLSGETYASSEKDTDISAVFDFNIARNDFGETAIQSFTVTPVYLNWYNDAIQRYLSAKPRIRINIQKCWMTMPWIESTVLMKERLPICWMAAV
mgnify:CR=1 FL=1